MKLQASKIHVYALVAMQIAFVMFFVCVGVGIWTFVSGDWTCIWGVWIFTLDVLTLFRCLGLCFRRLDF